MPFDYRKLEGLVKEKCRTRAIFAYKMGLSERSISLKMNGKNERKNTMETNRNLHSLWDFRN